MLANLSTSLPKKGALTQHNRNFSANKLLDSNRQTNIHNSDSETHLAFFYDDQIGTINQLSNHLELENHIHPKTWAVQFALFLSIEATESKPFTFQILAMVLKSTGQNKTTRAI